MIHIPLPVNLFLQTRRKIRVHLLCIQVATKKKSRKRETYNFTRSHHSVFSTTMDSTLARHIFTFTKYSDIVF